MSGGDVGWSIVVMVDVVVVAEVVGVVDMEVPEVAERDFDASSSSSLECE